MRRPDRKPRGSDDAPASVEREARKEAGYDRGVLTVRIPVAEQARPRKIEITSGNGRKAIETSSTQS
jgi:HSP20 family molecular chaperone IbpA